MQKSLGQFTQHMESSCKSSWIRPLTIEDISSVDRTKERPIHLSMNNEVPAFFLTKIKSLVIKMTKTNDIQYQTAFTLSKTQHVLYKFLCSWSQSQQIIPTYSDFILMFNEPLNHWQSCLLSRNPSQSTA